MTDSYDMRWMEVLATFSEKESTAWDIIEKALDGLTTAEKFRILGGIMSTVVYWGETRKGWAYWSSVASEMCNAMPGLGERSWDEREAFEQRLADEEAA